MADHPSSSPKTPARSLGAGISVLRFMVNAGRPLGLTQIGTQLGMSKSSTHDMLHALRDLGFVEQDSETRKYLISAGIFAFIHDFAEHYGPNAKINHALLREAERLQCGIYVHVIVGKSVFLICAAGRNAPTSSLGVEAPSYASSAGKILVAQKPEKEWPNYAPPADAVAFTTKTVTRPASFLKQVRLAREEGVAWNEGEHSETTCSVATFIPERNRISKKSVALVFTADEWLAQDRTKLAAEVKKVASELASNLFLG